MLTSIEIDGYKTFEGFHLDLSPFAVVVGPNAVGKSNLFDVIQLLSGLAEHDLRKAFTGRRGEADDVFRRTASGEHAERIQIAVECPLEPTIEDPWGKRRDLGQTRIRYELEIRRKRQETGLERLIVSREKAVPIRASEDRWRPFGDRPGKAFKDRFLRHKRRAPFLETVVEEGRASFRISQDGHQGRSRPAEAPERESCPACVPPSSRISSRSGRRCAPGGSCSSTRPP